MNNQKPVVIVDGHPSINGFSTKAADAFEAAAVAQGIPVKRYRAMDFPRAGDIMREGYKSEYEALRSDFTNARAICFTAPVWWFHFPGALKDVLDEGLQARVHFKYVKKFGIGVPVGLMDKNIQVHLAFTTGGPKWTYQLGIVPNLLKKCIFKTFQTCGISRWKCFSYHLGSASNRTPKSKVNAWLDTIKSIQF